MPVTHPMTSPSAEKMSRVKVMQVRTDNKEDSYAGEVYATTNKESFGEEKSEGHGKIPCVTCWFCSNRSVQGDVLGSAPGPCTGCSGFSVALLCKGAAKGDNSQVSAWPSWRPSYHRAAVLQKSCCHHLLGVGGSLPHGFAKSVVHISWLLVICRFCCMPHSTGHPDLIYLYQLVQLPEAISWS